MNGKTALYIFLFFAAVYGIFSIGHYGGDGYQDYLTAESIVLDGNLSLYDRPQDKDELEYIKDVGTEGRGGRTYSSRGVLGMPMLLAPFYLAGHLISTLVKSAPHDYVTMLAVSFANPVICALICMMVFLISEKLEFDIRTSTVLALITGLCTMLPVYARAGFPGPAVVLLLLLSVNAMVGYRSLFAIRHVFFSALFLSLMVLCKAYSVIFIPCFLIYIIWVLASSSLPAHTRAGHVTVFMAVCGVFLALLLLTNRYIYGGALTFGGVNAAAIGKRILGAPHVLKGFYYYLLSTGKGFFIYNIPVILSFFALDRALMKRKKITALFLLIFAVNLLFYVKSFRRGSLFCWGPRYLLPSAPLLVILLGYYLEKYRNALSKTALWAASIAGFLMMLPCMLVNQSKFYFFVVEKLKLEEYMINFIPDLSPIKGAWWMLISKVGQATGAWTWEFVYDPDYKLVAPVSAVMDGYNYFDIWFLKVMEVAPGYGPAVSVILAAMALVAAFSLYKICFER